MQRNGLTQYKLRLWPKCKKRYFLRVLSCILSIFIGSKKSKAVRWSFIDTQPVNESFKVYFYASMLGFPSQQGWMKKIPNKGRKIAKLHESQFPTRWRPRGSAKEGASRERSLPSGGRISTLTIHHDIDHHPSLTTHCYPEMSRLQHQSCRWDPPHRWAATVFLFIIISTCWIFWHQ